MSRDRNRLSKGVFTEKGMVRLGLGECVRAHQVLGREGIQAGGRAGARAGAGSCLLSTQLISVPLHSWSRAKEFGP